MSQPLALRPRPLARAVYAILWLAGIASPLPALAQSLTFAQAPPMTTTVTSAGVMPNVIVAVDGTGSMGSYDATCMTPGTVRDANGKAYTVGCTGNTSRYIALSDSLVTAFSDPSLIGKFRLAFESTNIDAGFGPNRFNPSPYDNSMKVFTAAYQVNFLQWAYNLRGNGYTCNPTEGMIAYAGEYLKGNWVSATAKNYTCEAGSNPTGLPQYRTDGTSPSFPNSPGSPDPSVYLVFNSVSSADSPWNDNQNLRTNLATSATDDAKTQTSASQLSCRRSFTIFMTDGGVNGNQFDPVGTNNPNYDNTAITLPDGKIYDPSAYYGPLYADNSVDNYADHTLYYWATDLTGKGANVVNTANSMPVTTNQTVTYGDYSTTFEPYWNPQNDPATWQHMQTYTIGFGTSNGAGQLPAGSYYSPQYGGARITIPIAFDSMYGNIFNLFATGAANGGTISWPWVSQYDGGITSSPSTDVAWDVLHAAYNGRGVFYPATSASVLTIAFAQILQDAITASAGAPATIASATASASQLTSATVSYTAGYSYDSTKATFVAGTGWGAASGSTLVGSIGGWTGSLTANAGNNPSGTPLWSATIPTTRQIFTASSTGTGMAFEYPATAGQQLNGDPSNIAKATVAVVRDNPLGDIVDSQLTYVGLPSRVSLDAGYVAFAQAMNGRKGVVYVGANDGMLHGFDAGNGVPAPGSPTDTSTLSTGNPGTGQEVMAYVPRGLMVSPRPGSAGLKDLSAFNDAGYQHQYWVDGSPFSGDAQLGATAGGIGSPNNWGTVLVGTLGAGGPGYFVLDVTSPGQLSESNTTILPKAVLIDATDIGTNSPLAGQAITNGSSAQVGQSVRNYLGSQFGQPVMDQLATYQSAQIVQINTQVSGGEWAVIMGNGYNSLSGVPVLLIQSLSQTDGHGHLKLYTVAASCTATAIACQSAGNGLGMPRTVDVDGNGTADIVYAGDLLGNLWKFDISNVDKTQWNVAYGGSPMFTAVGPSGAAQPIVSAPLAVPNPTGQGGFMVAFGTGKNLGVTASLDDTQDTRTNSIYALYDNQPMSVTTQTLVAASGPNPAIVASQVTLGSSAATPSSPALPQTFCAAGSGPARYAACLYQQGGGALISGIATGLLVGSSALATALPAGQAETIDGVTMRGWYYDIPEVANGNAAKVLANPVLLQGNTLGFYSQNVLSSSTTGNSSSAPSSTTESCSTLATTANPAVTTVSLFNATTGAAPASGVTVTLPGLPSPITLPVGSNRAQIGGVTTYLQSGANSLVSAGGSLSLGPLNVPGRRAGWRMLGQ